MRRRWWLWPVLVCALTLLIELPASWLVRASGLSAGAVSGSVWQGSAQRLGDVGPVDWHWRAWRQEARIRLSFQGQQWQVQVHGWPWRWRASVETLDGGGGVHADYRLAGHWQGRVQLQGAWQRCETSQGRLQGNDLALVAPWSLGLGQGWIEVRCADGWRLLAGLDAQEQHRIGLDADLLTRRGTLTFALENQAALLPVLRGMQWLGPDAREGQRRIRW